MSKEIPAYLETLFHTSDSDRSSLGSKAWPFYTTGSGAPHRIPSARRRRPTGAPPTSPPKRAVRVTVRRPESEEGAEQRRPRPAATLAASPLVSTPPMCRNVHFSRNLACGGCHEGGIGHGNSMAPRPIRWRCSRRPGSPLPHPSRPVGAPQTGCLPRALRSCSAAEDCRSGAIECRRADDPPPTSAKVAATRCAERFESVIARNY